MIHVSSSLYARNYVILRYMLWGRLSLNTVTFKKNYPLTFFTLGSNMKRYLLNLHKLLFLDFCRMEISLMHRPNLPYMPRMPRVRLYNLCIMSILCRKTHIFVTVRRAISFTIYKRKLENVINLHWWNSSVRRTIDCILFERDTKMFFCSKSCWS